MKQYCVTCHNQRLKTGNLALDGAELTNIPATAETWEKVARKVRAGQMPPAGVPRPSQADLTSLVAHVESAIDKAAAAHPELRGPAIHRLNRSEYANAVRDLFAVSLDVAAMLPPDEEAYGFDNNATVLGISTSLMERYLSAAWKVAGVAVASPKITPSLETFRVRGDLSQHDHVDGLPIGTRGGIAITHYFPVDAEYVISPRLYRETVNIIRGLELAHELEVAIDGQRVRLAAFGGPKDEQANYLQPTLAGDEMEKRFQVRMPITAGLHTITVAFIKKSSATTLELLQPFGRERIDPITPVGIPELDRVTLEGPVQAGGHVGVIAQPPQDLRVRASGRPGCGVRVEDPDHGGAPRVSRAAERGGNPAPGRVLRRGAQEGRQLHRRHRGGAALRAGEPAVPVPGGAGPGERCARHRLPHPAISSWRRACRSSSGAASRTTSC